MHTMTEETKQKMRVLFNQACESEQLPGASAIVVHRGEVIWTQSYGVANLETEQVVTADTIYHIGSVTKIFTAIMLMQLRDRGKLRLDDPLEQYLPEMRELAYPPITLKQLVSHTSGLPTMPPLEELTRIMEEFPPTLDNLGKASFPSIKTIIDSLGKVQLQSEPGAEVLYSNLGIALLAHALARVAHQSYTSYIENEILHPVSMKDSGFWARVRHAANVATCYLPFFLPLEAAPSAMKRLNGFTSAGGLWASANDMALFLGELTSPSSSSALLNRHSQREMVESVALLESSHYTGRVGKSGIGVGWFLSQIQNRLLAEHGGADPSTAAYVGWVPALELGGFMGTNTGKNPGVAATIIVDLLEVASQVLDI